MKGEYLKLDTVKTMAELLNENKELRERIDKAIEYIECELGIEGDDIYLLLKILKEEKFDIKKEKEFEYMEEYLIQKRIEGEE